MSDEDTNQEEQEQNTTIHLKLGDIIHIIAPSNPELNENSFFIEYIDSQKMKCIDIATMLTISLGFDENERFTDESILEIHLLSRSDELGYARQNGLLPNTWVDISFHGDVPIIITGEITNLEEDMIEITTFPDKDIIYIDFEYKGIPENIPLEKITIREPPQSAKYKEYDDESFLKSVDTIEEESELEDDAPLPDVKNQLHQIYLDADNIFNDNKEDVVQLVEIAENKKRYGIEAQVNDLTDELLSTIPNHKRTADVLQQIQILIQRFKELREKFSVFNENGMIVDIKLNSAYYKPLIEKITNLNTKIRWILPVVSQTKNIYNVNAIHSSEDTNIIKMSTNLIEQNEWNEKYKKNQIIGNIRNNYDEYYNQLENYTNPFTVDNNNNNNEFALYRSSVLENIETVVGSLSDLYSSVYFDKSVIKRKFVIQRYNLGLKKIQINEMKSGKKVHTLANLTPNDPISIQSFITLPEAILHYSRVDLPGTNILEKTHLGQIPFYLFSLLNRKTPYSTQFIKKLDKEANPNETNLLQGITEYVLDHDMENRYADDPDKNIDAFLNTIIPSTRKMIEMIEPKYNMQFGGLSFIDFIQSLEPFYIYSDTVVYSQYNTIRYFLKEKIKKYNLAYKEKEIQFSFYKLHSFHVKPNINTFEFIFSTKNKLWELFKNVYSIHSEESSSTILESIVKRDNGVFFHLLVRYMLYILIIPNKLVDAWDKPYIEDLTRNEEKIVSDCSKRFLAKKYSSLQELQKDNNRDDIYYDRDLDDTPYDLLHRYKDSQKKMIPEMFLEFLEENLIEKHDCPKELAKDLAIALVAKKKKVKNGEYAILQIIPTLPDDKEESELSDAQQESMKIEKEVFQKISYYRRVQNIWVHSEDVNEYSFINTNDLFCNSDEKCNKNTKLGTCESNSIAQIRMRQTNHNNKIKEFQNRYNITVEELQEDLEKKIREYERFVQRKTRIEEVHLHKNNHYAYHLGKMYKQNDTEVKIVSPYIRLRELILAEVDFVKKQKNICRFVFSFCRQPIVDKNEDVYWLYCKDTNTKLFPYSIYELALTFVDGEDYSKEMEYLCSKQGILSESGDAIIDQYTGYELRKINYNTDDEYNDAGFKVITHVQVDIPDMVYEDETLQKMHNICSSICKNLHISIEDSFVLRISNDISKKIIQDEKKYNLYLEKNEKKQKKNTLPPYEIYRNQMIIMIVASVLLVYIQTYIPSFQRKKPFPGCVFSFSGYPFGGGGEEDMSSIKYIACVVNKMKTSIVPWNSLDKLKEDLIANIIRNTIDKYLMNDVEIDKLVFLKREYLVLHPEEMETKEEEHIEKKWIHFLPPIIPFTISKNIPSISKDTVGELFHLIENGKKDQREHISIFKGKLTQYSFGIIEKIYGIVRTKDVLLRTLSKIPFLDNACCNERMDRHVIAYFAKEEPIIDKYIKASMDLENILSNVHELSVASIYYHPFFTGLKNGLVLPNGYTEETIYSAFIYYCHLDNDSPIPKNMLGFINEKPREYNKYWTMMEKIDFLKRNGKQFTLNDLYQLVRIINQENMIHLYPEPTITLYSPILEFLDNMEQINSPIIPEPLRRTLNEYLQNIDEPTKEISLMNYLKTANHNMFELIMNFMDVYGNIGKREYDNIHQFLYDLDKWNNDDIHIITHFIQNAIMAMSKNNPSIIIHRESYSNIPSHWKLASKHSGLLIDIIQKYNAVFQPFKEDDTIKQFLIEIMERLNDLSLFVIHIPLSLKKEILSELYMFCMYSCIYEYTLCSDEIIELDIQSKKKEIRMKKQENINDADQIFADSEADADSDIEDIEIQEGNKEDFKRTIGGLLLQFIQLEQKNKAVLDKTYQQIAKNVFKTKKAEKDEITGFFEKMNVDDRKIENSMKKYKLDRWNVGLQRGLVEYDAKLYNNQFDENKQRMLNELDENNFHITVDNIEDKEEIIENDGEVENVPPVIAYDREFPANDDEYNGYDSGDGDGDYNDDDDFFADE
jgi:hypothetical protein